MRCCLLVCLSLSQVLQSPGITVMWLTQQGVQGPENSARYCTWPQLPPSGEPAAAVFTTFLCFMTHWLVRGVQSSVLHLDIKSGAH